MVIPTFESLKTIWTGENSDSFLLGFNGTFLHKNPRFYKYYWLVFHDECTEEGHDFLNNPKNLLCGYDMTVFVKKLKRDGKMFFLYNRSVKRLDKTAPWDKNHSMYKDYKWAPDFDDDTDNLYWDDIK